MPAQSRRGWRPRCIGQRLSPRLVGAAPTTGREVQGRGLAPASRSAVVHDEIPGADHREKRRQEAGVQADLDPG